MIEREYDISGAIGFWSLQPTPYQALLEALEAKGYGQCMPNVRTDQSALENAIKTNYGTKNKAVVSRKKPKQNGVELVEIERGREQNYYTTSFGAKVVGGAVKADMGAELGPARPGGVAAEGDALPGNAPSAAWP
jgi:hypothetical protein